jgi:hypothetical protein
VQSGGVQVPYRIIAAVIDVAHLGKRYGDTLAVDVDFPAREVPRIEASPALGAIWR